MAERVMIVDNKMNTKLSRKLNKRIHHIGKEDSDHQW